MGHHAGVDLKNAQYNVSLIRGLLAKAKEREKQAAKPAAKPKPKPANGKASREMAAAKKQLAAAVTKAKKIADDPRDLSFTANLIRQELDHAVKRSGFPAPVFRDAAHVKEVTARIVKATERHAKRAAAKAKAAKLSAKERAKEQAAERKRHATKVRKQLKRAQADRSRWIRLMKASLKKPSDLAMSRRLEAFDDQVTRATRALAISGDPEKLQVAADALENTIDYLDTKIPKEYPAAPVVRGIKLSRSSSKADVVKRLKQLGRAWKKEKDRDRKYEIGREYDAALTFLPRYTVRSPSLNRIADDTGPLWAEIRKLDKAGRGEKTGNPAYEALDSIALMYEEVSMGKRLGGRVPTWDLLDLGPASTKVYRARKLSRPGAQAGKPAQVFAAPVEGQTKRLGVIKMGPKLFGAYAPFESHMLKTYGGAVRWLAKRGYKADGSRLTK
jgi:hypothetical protein